METLDLGLTRCWRDMMNLWNKNCYFGPELHLVSKFMMKNLQNKWSYFLSHVQSALQNYVREESASKIPQEMLEWENLPFANQEPLFQASVQKRS